MEGLNSPTGHLRPNQASCAASATTPLPHTSLMSTYSFYRLQGNPDFFIEAIVISVWILGAARWGGRGAGTTRCPCWQRCIKTGMSHRICRAHLTASKGGSSVPLFSPSLQSASSLPPPFASSLSLLNPPPALYDPAVRDPPTTLHRIRMPIDRKHSVYK